MIGIDGRLDLLPFHQLVGLGLQAADASTSQR